MGSGKKHIKITREKRIDAEEQRMLLEGVEAAKERFLAAGGKIEVIPYGISGEPEAVRERERRRAEAQLAARDRLTGGQMDLI